MDTICKQIQELFKILVLQIIITINNDNINKTLSSHYNVYEIMNIDKMSTLLQQII